MPNEAKIEINLTQFSSQTDNICARSGETILALEEHLKDDHREWFIAGIAHVLAWLEDQSNAVPDATFKDIVEVWYGEVSERMP